MLRSFCFFMFWHISFIKMHFLLPFFYFAMNARCDFWAQNVENLNLASLVWSISPSTITAIKQLPPVKWSRFLKFCLILSQCLFSIFLIAKTCVSVGNPSRNQCCKRIRANGPWQSNLRSVMMSERIFKLATMNCITSWSSDRCLAALVLMMRNRLLFCVPFCFRFVCEHIESVSIVSTVHSD